MSPQNKKPQPNAALKYSAMGMQMGFTIAVFAYGGHWLDGYFKNSTPIFTLVLLLLGTMGSIFSLIKQLK